MRNESIDNGKVQFKKSPEATLHESDLNDIVQIMKQRNVRELLLSDEEGAVIGVMSARHFLQILGQDADSSSGKVEH